MELIKYLATNWDFWTWTVTLAFFIWATKRFLAADEVYNEMVFNEKPGSAKCALMRTDIGDEQPHPWRALLSVFSVADLLWPGQLGRWL